MGKHFKSSGLVGHTTIRIKQLLYRDTHEYDRDKINVNSLDRIIRTMDEQFFNELIDG